MPMWQKVSYLLVFPDQVQEELSRVIGSRQVLAEDRINLPYTNAVIHETQRVASVLPLSLPHTTKRDVTFQGYFIKKVGYNCFSFFQLNWWNESFFLEQTLLFLMTGNNCFSPTDVCSKWWEWMGESTHIQPSTLLGWARQICEERCIHALLCWYGADIVICRCHEYAL